MDDAGTVRLVECVGNFNGVTKRRVEGERPFRQSLRQTLAIEVLHDEKVDPVLMPDVVKRADVRMVQCGDRTCLALESLAHSRVVADV